MDGHWPWLTDDPQRHIKTAALAAIVIQWSVFFFEKGEQCRDYRNSNSFLKYYFSLFWNTILVARRWQITTAACSPPPEGRTGRTISQKGLQILIFRYKQFDGLMQGCWSGGWLNRSNSRKIYGSEFSDDYTGWIKKGISVGFGNLFIPIS